MIHGPAAGAHAHVVEADDGKSLHEPLVHREVEDSRSCVSMREDKDGLGVPVLEAEGDGVHAHGVALVLVDLHHSKRDLAPLNA